MSVLGYAGCYSVLEVGVKRRGVWMGWGLNSI